MSSSDTRSTAHPNGILMLLNRFVRDKRGVGGIEFALIAPLLLALYITSCELTIGFSVSKKLTRSTSTMADIITQETSVNKDLLASMKDVADSLFAPYAAKNLKIKITGVTMDAAGKPTVLWSWNEAGARAYTVGSSVAVPDEMRLPNSFLVRAEVSVDHSLLMFMPNLLPTTVNNITLRREYFYRQRLNNSINCSNC